MESSTPKFVKTSAHRSDPDPASQSIMGDTMPAPPAFTAGRIKYADPRSLPSFPSTGLRSDGAAASAAASLGWANQKPVDLWKPDKSSSAASAAVLAKDYKVGPMWQRGDADSAGARAAVLAHGSAGAALNQSNAKSSPSRHEGWGNSAATQAFHANRPATVHSSGSSHGNSAAAQAFAAQGRQVTPQGKPRSAHGNSAATQAFNASRTMSMKNSTPSPNQFTADRSLAAAKGAMSGTRPRAISTPAVARNNSGSHALETGAASSALNGAALAHRQSMMAKTPAADAGAVPVTTMTRNMFTYHPPVKPQMDEQADADRLHQSAVAMAQKMYANQQKAMERAKDGHEEEAGAGTYLNLQDAAYKMAQERLAKLSTEHQKNREMQEYYINTPPSPTHRRRFSAVNKLRRRSAGSEDEFDDHARSSEIRQQMSMFSNKLSEVDKTKRTSDREALMLAAQRNVKARLQGMDQKVQNDTGMINPSMASDWELRAQDAARTRQESRNVNQGKIHIGGGKYLSQEEINAIAASRVQPVLDDINEKAETERERVAVLKLEQEARQSEAEKQKTRDREIKELTKKARADQKAEEKARKQQEKAALAEEKRLAKEEKRKSKQGPVAAVVDDHAEEDEAEEADERVIPVHDDMEEVAPAPEHDAIAPTAAADTTGHAEPVEDERVEMSGATAAGGASAGDVHFKSAEGSQKPKRMSGWLKNRFSRSKSVSEEKDESAAVATPKETTPKEKAPKDKRRSFFGLGGKKNTGSTTSLENRQSSMRDVAMARDEENEDADNHDDDDDSDEHEMARPRAAAPAADSHGISPMSSDDEDDLYSSGDERPAKAPKKSTEEPPSLDVPIRSGSPMGGSRFREEISP